MAGSATARLAGSGALSASASVVPVAAVGATLAGAGSLTVDDAKVFVLRLPRKLDMEDFLGAYGGAVETAGSGGECLITAYEGECFISAREAGVESTGEDDGDVFIRTAA